jgi:hypothetical protein
MSEGFHFYIYRLSDIIGNVPSGAFLNSSSFIFFLGRIMAGGTKQPTGYIQQNTVMVWPLSAETTLGTKRLPFGEITLGVLSGTLEIPLSSILNMQWAGNFFSSEIILKLSKNRWHWVY